jgi:predicted transcriptional regulator
VQVHQVLAGLGRAAPAQERREPVVPIRRSVQQDYVVCLECGYAAQMLRRHLRVAHGLEAADYRSRWQLPPATFVMSTILGAVRDLAGVGP